MASRIDLSQLALRVYNASDANRTSIPAGWVEVRYIPDEPSGFSGGIYFNPANSEVVVSYTGVNELLVGDAAMSASLLFGLALPGFAQVKRAVDLYLEAKTTFPGMPISFTGHSLGGGLASLMAVYFNRPATVFAEAPFEPSAKHTFTPALIPDPALAIRIAILFAYKGTLRSVKEYLDANGGDSHFNALYGDASNQVFALREQAVTNVYVAGEWLNALRFDWNTIYFGQEIIEIGNSQLGFVHRHNMGLHVALQESELFHEAASRLPTFLPAVFDKTLFHAGRTDPNASLISHLILHHFGTRTQLGSGPGATVTETRAPDFMLNRMGTDLLKLANRGVSGQSPALVNGLIQLALQRYYEFGASALPSGFAMLEELSGGLKFDMSQIANGQLAAVKGYRPLSGLLGLDTNRGLPRPAPALPSLTNWYVQVGTADSGRLVAAGGADAELFWGGASGDVLSGGGGADVLIGGLGHDGYHYGVGDGADTIYETDGEGQILVGGAGGFALGGGVASILPGTWRDDAHRITYKKSGRDLVVSGDGLGGGENTITLKGFIPNDLGIELRREPKVAVSEGPQRNVWQQLGYSASDFATTLREGAAKVFTIALNSAAEAGERLLLTIPGGGIVLAKLKAILGSEEVSFASGTVEVALSEGQSQVTIALVEQGDVDSDQALTFTATLQSDDPDFTPVASNTVTINFDARDEAADPQTTHDIFGDRGYEEIIVNGLPQFVIDQWGNRVTTDEVIPDLSDFRFDLPANDNIQVGGAAIYAGPGSDYVRAFRGGDDVIEQTGAGRIWTHAGDGNDVLVGGEGANFDPFTLFEQRQDMLNGGAGDDRIYGETRISLEDAIEAGNTEAASDNPWEGDFLAGNAGDDVVIAGADRDLLAGGGGKDVLVARAGDDVILGDADYSAADVIELGYAGWGHAGMYWIEEGTPDDFTITVFNTHPGAVTDPADSDADTIYAGGGDDLVFAGGGDDLAYGDAGDDRLWGEGGSDALLGGEGDDLLVGEATGEPVGTQSSDFLDGGDGNDTLLGGGASDAIYGGGGNDEVSGDSADANAGDDYIDGEAGDDLLIGAGGADEIYGGEGDDLIGGDASNADSSVHGDDYIDAEAGDDVVVGGGKADTIFGGAGDDHLEGDGDESAASVQGDDYLDGEAGDDEINGGGGGDTIFGGEGDDKLFGEGADDPEGTAGDDFIDGEAGDDLLVGGAGSDQLYGGEGVDRLFGESADPDEEQGDDLLDGGEGDDELNGGGGADVLIGGEGVDFLSGDAANTADADMGDDVLDGGDGNDIMAGAGGNDILEGGAGDDQLDGDGANIAAALHGNDHLSGGAGIDQLIGGGGDDTLDGGDGDDVLQGGDGDDTLEGGDGDDILTGGTGTNVLSGGAGDDFYFFRRGDGHQTIIDPDGVDVLYVEPGLTIFDLQFTIGSLKITDGVAGDEIHIEGFDPNDPLGTLAIEQIVFLQDGSSYNLADLVFGQPFQINGTPQSDSLTGTAFSDLINGFEDGDFIFAGDGDDTIDAGEGDDVVDAGEGFDTVTAGDGNDIVFGGDDGDTLNGGAGDDLVLGEAGDDVLDGGEGADTLAGGSGDDIYVVDAGDTASENPDEGFDTVEADFSYTLGANFEELSLGGDQAGLVGTGNDEANVISANGAGSALFGMGGNDQLFGNLGSDTLDGGSGADTLEGGDGDDFYVVDDSSDQVVEEDLWFSDQVITRGQDAVESSVSYVLPKFVENLVLTGDAEIDGTGNSEGNLLAGNDAANVLVSTLLDGKNDNLVSGLGSVTFIDFPGAFPTGADERLWDRALRRYFEGEITVNDLESMGEQIFVDARGGDVLEGNGGDDTLIGGWDHDDLLGGDGDDLLLGSGGEDTMEGGAGDDLYVVDGNFSFVFGYSNSAGIFYQDDSSDVLFEAEDQGADTVWANLDWVLDANFENLVLIDSSTAIPGVAPGDGLLAIHEMAVVGEGNELANEITGNARGNELFGNEGDDRLVGGRGNDFLYGGEGADTMYGGTHDDTYEVDDEGDLVIETGNGFTFNGFDSDPDGFADWVESSLDSYTLPDFVENLRLNDGFFGTGNELDNTILGNENDNVLAGLDGDDSMDGGDGDDILLGGSGNDVLQGGAGDDEMTGGLGDDTYYVDSLGDSTAEGFDEGRDTVYSTQSTTLGDNLEDLYLLGGDDLEGTGNAIDNRIFGNDGSNFLQGLGGGDTIEGGWGGDLIEGGDGDDILSGGGDDDQLYGGAGTDSLDGGSGADYLEGGAGDETYFVDDDFDQVVENFGEGADAVFERLFSYQTPDNVENATILGDFQDNPDFAQLFGNTLDNSLTGSDGGNYIDDFAGGHDTIDGRAGSDSLNGRAGADALYGGDDATRIESGYFRFDKGQGTWQNSDSEDPEAVRLELEVLADNHDFLAGGEGVDQIDGGSGNDSLYGEQGDDVLYGGDDGLTADRFSGDGGEGGFELGAPVFLTNDDYLDGGDGADQLDGGSGDDRLFGGGGADTLLGGADGPLNTSNRDYLDGGTSSSIDAIDTMSGGTDDDEYVVDGFFVETIGTIFDDCGDPIPNQAIRVWTTDVVVENAGEGDDDLVVAAADYTLPDHVERLILSNQSAFALFGRGNSLDNNISGNDNHNRLEGAGGDDFIYGGHGNDVIDGGAGDDRLMGWFGNDTFLLRTGSGRDTLLFDGTPGSDTVHVLDDLAAADITLSRHANDVVIGLNGTQDRMLLENWFLSPTQGVSQIIFCDDPALDRAAIAALANQRFVVASDDLASVAEDGALVATGNVLDNDNDAGSDPAAVLHVARPGIYQGSYGTLVLALNGDYAYTLDNDAVQWLSENGGTSDQFQYEAEDEAQAFGEARLVINIDGANDAPEIVGGATLGAVTEDAGEVQYQTDGGSLLENGGFEDDFFGWQLDANTMLAGIDFFNGPEGIRSARFGAVGSPTLLGQEIDTDAGQRYLLRFYADGDFFEGYEGSAAFSASWNGETLMALGNVDLEGFTAFEFAVTGADTSQLEFSLQHDPDYWRLDAVELLAITGEEVFTNSVQSAAGTIQFTDIDRFDGHFSDLTAQGGVDYVGDFFTELSVDSFDGQVGNVNWFFQVDNDAIDYLAQGDTLEQTYDVTVSDFFGGSATQTVTVLMHGANDAPEAFGVINDVEEDVTLVAAGNVLDENGAFDPDQGTVLSIVAPGSFAGEWGTLVLDADGSYTYTLDNGAVQFLAQDQQLEEFFGYEITDGALTSSATLNVAILGTNDAPVTAADFADVAEDAVFTAGGNVLDNDFDIDEDETPAVSATGTFGGLYGTLTLAEDGAYAYLLDNDLEAVQRLHAGEVLLDEFGYEAIDDFAATPGTLSVRITGANDAPVANADAAQVHEDGVLSASGNALANDFDRDHDTLLQVADPGGRSGAYGKLQLAEDGSYTYTLKNKLADFLHEGQTVYDSFAYTATDADPLDPLSAQSSITVEVVGANDAPVTVKDTANVSEDGVLAASGNVLGNDSDPDSGTTLSVANAGTFAGNFGTLVLQADGSYSYELANDSALVQSLRAGQIVSDVFAYVASDGMAQTPGRLTVKIAGANDPSQAFADSASVREDLAPVATGNVLVNDADADLGALLVVSNPGAYAGAHGTLVLTAQGGYTYTLDNAAAQTLDDDDLLTEVFGYTAGDGVTESSSTLTVTISGLNDHPDAVADFTDVGEDAVLAAAGNVLANDSDVDDSLTAVVPGIHTGAYGTLTLESDGDYSYSLNNAALAVQSLRHDQTVLDVFAYSADDGQVGTLSTLTVRVAGANDAPVVANAIPDQNADAGSAFSFAFAANTFADIDQGDVLSYTALLADGSALPDWLSFDPQSRTFTGTPPGGGGHCEGGGVDRLDIRITAADLVGATAFDEFALDIAGGAGGGGQTIIGTDGNDVLVGTPCDDVIDGRKGFDVMSGGDGDDTYYVDRTCAPEDDDDHGNEGVGNGEDPPPPGHDRNQNDGPGTSPGHPGSKGGQHSHDDDDDHGDDDHDDDDDDDHEQCKVDEVIEQANQGYDVVYASTDYTLPANVEEVRLLGAEDLDATGNALDNVLVGNRGDNRLEGGRGADVYVHELYGGDDVIKETGPESDTLRLGEGITADMVRLKRRHDDLVVDLSGPHGSVTVKGWFDSPSKRVERIEFADGSAWEVQEIKDEVRRPRHFEPDEDDGFPRHDRDRDDDRRRDDQHDGGGRHRDDDDRRRDRIADSIAGRLSHGPRFDFDELHGLPGKPSRPLSKDEIGSRWRAVAQYAQSLGAGDDDGREGAWLPRMHGAQHGFAGHGGSHWGFEGSTGASRGQDGLKTLEGLIEGFRKL